VLACSECCLFFLQKMAFQMNLGYNETAFVMQIMLQPGRQNLRNIVQYGYTLSTVSFSIKYVMNFQLFLAAVSALL
jgi:hypothetical protein